MSNIKVLKQKRADIINEAEALFATATSEGRVLTEKEMSRDTEIEAELKGLNTQIDAAERQAERMRQLDNRAPLDPNAAADRLASTDRDGRPRFESLGSQMLAIARAGMPNSTPDSRLAWTNIGAGPTGQGEAVGSDGGFLIQTDFQAGMLDRLYAGGEIAKRITRLPLGPNSNGMAMNGLDETNRTNGSRWGGIQAYWTAEAGQYTASQAKFRKIKMDLEKLTGLLYATDEILADATFLEGWIAKAFNSEFEFKVEDAVMQGIGGGMPLGYLNSSAVITVNKEASQVAATIVSENIMKMWTRMPSRLRSNCVWLINQDIEPQLYQMNIKVKNVAGTENVGGIAVPQVVYTPPGTAGSDYGKLMGRPVIPVEYAATLGTAGDIQLVDLSQYLMIDKGAPQGQSSIHVRFLFGETAFRFTYRANGQPLHAAAITPYKGTTTQSPYVILQTR